MTISTYTPKQSTANGTAVDFVYDFKIWEATDIKVVVADDDGVETVKSYGIDYTVSGVGEDTGGTVTFVTAPTSGYIVTISSNVPTTQETEFPSTGPFLQAEVESALDKNVRMMQQVKEQVDRSLKVPLTSQGANTEIDMTPLSVIRINADGDGFESVTPEQASLSGTFTPDLGNMLVGDGSTWASSTPTEVKTSLGLTVGTDVQAYDADLTAIAALTDAGLIAKTGSGTAASRTLTAGSGISVTNGTGASGDPTVAVDMTGLTGETTVDASADYFMMYDNSAAANRKVLLQSLFTSVGFTPGSTVFSVTQSSHGFAVGDVLKLSGTTWAKAQANTAASAEVAGVVSGVTDTNNFNIAASGLITGLSGLTAGTVYFLSDSSAGAYTATAPSTAGYIVRPVLLAVTTTSAIYLPYRGNEVGGGAGSGSSGITAVVQDTAPVLGGNLDVSTYAITDSTRELIKFTKTGSAVNEITVANAATTGDPSVKATGDDTNINLLVMGKGTGGVRIGNAAATAITNVLDEDNMASDSATALATQQSIKAYVDTEIASATSGITAGKVTKVAVVTSSTTTAITYAGITYLTTSFTKLTGTSRILVQFTGGAYYDTIFDTNYVSPAYVKIEVGANTSTGPTFGRYLISGTTYPSTNHEYYQIAHQYWAPVTSSGATTINLKANLSFSGLTFNPKMTGGTIIIMEIEP